MIFLNTRTPLLSLFLFSTTVIALPAYAQVINPYPISAQQGSEPVAEETVPPEEVEQKIEEANKVVAQPDEDWQRKSPGLSADELNNREWQLLQSIKASDPAPSEPPQEALAAPEQEPITEHELQQIEAEQAEAVPVPAPAGPAPEPIAAATNLPEPVTYNDDEWERQVEQQEAAGLAPPPPPMSAYTPPAEPEYEPSYKPDPVQSEPPVVAAAAPAWGAQEGENMQDVLARWSKRAGVTLVWDTRESFAVQQTVNFDTTYESAVRDLLGQYRQDDVRPYGVLNVEPGTNGRTLTIDSDESAWAG